MPQPLLPDKITYPAQPPSTVEAGSGDSLADLKIFWGPEICRLEYLVHLLETGRVKDDCVVRSVASR